MRLNWQLNWHFFKLHPAGIYLLIVNNRNTRARCKICSKLTIKTPKRRQWRCAGVFIINFERIWTSIYQMGKGSIFIYFNLLEIFGLQKLLNSPNMKCNIWWWSLQPTIDKVKANMFQCCFGHLVKIVPVELNQKWFMQVLC